MEVVEQPQWVAEITVAESTQKEKTSSETKNIKVIQQETINKENHMIPEKIENDSELIVDSDRKEDRIPNTVKESATTSTYVVQSSEKMEVDGDSSQLECNENRQDDLDRIQTDTESSKLSDVSKHSDTAQSDQEDTAAVPTTSINSTSMSSTSTQFVVTSSPIDNVNTKLPQDESLGNISPLQTLPSTTQEQCNMQISMSTVDSSSNSTIPLSEGKSRHSDITEPIDIIRNGQISAGKPYLLSMNRPAKKEKPEKSGRVRKPRSLVAMYESEISENKTGIKLCIKKSENSLNSATQTAAQMATAASSTTVSTSTSMSSSPSSSSTSTISKNRRGSRAIKQRTYLSSSSYTGTDDDSGAYYEPRRKKERTSKKTGSNAASTGSTRSDPAKNEIVEQGMWGSLIPEPVLYNIFKMVVSKGGCLPTLCRLGRVCLLWRRVSLMPSLWSNLDLSTWIKEKYRTELKLKWFVDNRCSWCTELNVSHWKVTNIDCFLQKLAVGAPKLSSITLAGWKGFTSDNLAFLVENMKHLRRLDLSSINAEMNASKSAVGLQSLCNALQTLNERLTHLYLAHNRLGGIPHLVNTLATHCSNLLLLDLSNVSTLATSHGVLHIEKLQKGCPKLKVLRITNSHISFNTATMQEMMDSPGFPDLEELSIAALSDESRVIGDEHLQRILKSSSKLKLLDVRSSGRLTHESLIRLPAWDIKHLFLSGCSVTRDMGSGLELIASKWAHSLIELDLAWANVQTPLDNALHALADRGSDSQLAHLNLCGSSVSENAVKEILANCPLMNSINLSSCRGLPRGVKRLMQGPQELNELREVLKVELKVSLPEELKPRTSVKKLPANHDSAIGVNAKGMEEEVGNCQLKNNISA